VDLEAHIVLAALVAAEVMLLPQVFAGPMAALQVDIM
jgi:hypothetical protein